MVLSCPAREEAISSLSGLFMAKNTGSTVIANQKSFAPGTLRSMIRQSGLSEDEFAS